MVLGCLLVGWLEALRFAIFQSLVSVMAGLIRKDLPMPTRSTDLRAPREQHKHQQPKNATSLALQWQRDHPDQARLVKSFQDIQSIALSNATKLESNNKDFDGEQLSTTSIGVGAVHGIPSSFHQGLQKIERQKYFLICFLSGYWFQVSPDSQRMPHMAICSPYNGKYFHTGELTFNKVRVLVQFKI